ncbi:MAG: helix-turn-helix domain-containing protein [Bosea sp. (in: a-proteobacteria)]
MNNIDPRGVGGYSDDEVDALAYSYVLSHGYEGALDLLEGLIDSRHGNDVEPDDVLTVTCQRIIGAIHDEAATIARILDRIIPTFLGTAVDPAVGMSFPRENPIDCHIGSRLRQRRSQLGLSLAALAADMSMTPDELATNEEGARRLDATELERAGACLDVPVTYFFQ